MDFSLDSTQIALRRLAGDFARQEIVPVAEEIDRTKDPARRFPSELLERGSKLGLRTLGLPEAAGGGGADLPALCFVGEEIGGGDLGVGATFAQDWCVARALDKSGRGARFSTFFKNFTEDHRAHLTAAEFIANPPSERRPPYPEEAAPIPASAIKGSGKWEVGGSDANVLNGATAKHLFLKVALEEGDPLFFLIENPEVARTVKHRDPLGMRTCENVALTLEGAAIPEDFRIPFSKDWWEAAEAAFLLLPVSAALGAARYSNEHAVTHARERVQGGKPIIEHQTVGFMLNDNLMELSAARQALHAAAWRAEQEKGNLLGSIQARIFIAEACERIAGRSMEVWGGAGYMTEAPMERLVRDVVAFLHTGETAHALRSRAMSMI